MTEDVFNKHIRAINVARCLLTSDREYMSVTEKGVVVHEAITAWLAIGDLFGVSGILEGRLAFIESLVPTPGSPPSVPTQALAVLDALAETPLDSVDFTAGLYKAMKLIVSAMEDRR